MNKVDLTVRAMMLAYPTLYSSRAKAFRGIFMGTNYSWKEQDGVYVVVPCYALEEDRDPMRDINECNDRRNGNSEFDQFVRVQNELERMTRQHKIDNIDMYAKMKSEGYGYSDLDDWYLDNDTSMIFNAPFGQIDSDWVRAMEEFISNMMVAYNMVFSLHYDNPLKGDKAPEPSMFSRMPEKFQKRHQRLKELEDKCEQQSGNKAAQRKFLKSIGMIK